MSMSRTSMVFQSQGDPFLGGLARIVGRVAGGGLIKRGASKIIQISKSPTVRAIAGIIGGGVVGAAAERVFGGAPGAAGAPPGFTVIRVSRPRAASPGGKPLQLLSPQGQIGRAHV